MSAPPLPTNPGDRDASSFEWIAADNAADNTLAFLRKTPNGRRRLLCIGNFSPVVRHGYRLGLPGPGDYREVVNTDAAVYGGSNVGNGGAIRAEPVPSHGRPWSGLFSLPPLGVLWFEGPPG